LRDPALELKLARAMGRAMPKSKAIEALHGRLEAEPDGASHEWFEATCRSLLLRGDGRVRDLLRRTIREHRDALRAAIACSLLAVAARADDVALLVDAFRLTPSAAFARSLGRFGHVGVLSALAVELDSKDEALVEAAAEALDRITGAGMRTNVEVPWNPGIEPPDGSPPPMRAVSAVVTDRLAWEQWLSRNTHRLDARAKLRGGAPFVPKMIVDELAARETPVHRRAEAAFELVVATGLGARFATDGWVEAQERKLAELDEEVRSFGVSPGAFWYGGAASTSA
jgi:hypothetical protein